MASLPKKGIKGTNFKVWAVETLNALIDYLHGARVKPGYGISVRETPSGTIVELAKKEAPTINNIAGGGAYGVTGFLNPSTNTGQNINQNQSRTTTAAGILVATAALTVAPGQTGGATSTITLTKNSQTIQIPLLSGAIDHTNSSTYGADLNSVCVPVDSGVTIEISYSTNGSATGSAYGMFYF